MCFSVSYLTHKNEVYARRLGISTDKETSFFAQLDQVRNYIGVAWYRSGFEFPGLPVLTLFPELKVIPGFWGLIPHWAKSKDKQKDLIKHTLNARIETLLEKPSFKKATEKNRCIVMLDGFFEYKHIEKKAHPYYITYLDKRPMLIGGIYEIAPDNVPFSITLSIVTKPGTALMTEIHNKSQAGEPRMPLILEGDYLQKWTSYPAQEAIQECKNLEINNLTAIPVGSLTGKNGIGNKPQAHITIHLNPTSQ